MNPINFPEANHTLAAPAGMEKSVLPLPICLFQYTDEFHSVISCWELSDAEREEVAHTGRVYVLVHGITHPPIRVDGIKPPELDNLATACTAKGGE